MLPALLRPNTRCTAGAMSGPPARDKAAHQPFSLKEQGEGAPLQQSGVHPVADDGVRGPLPITRQIFHDVRPPVIKRTLPCWAGGRGLGSSRCGLAGPSGSAPVVCSSRSRMGACRGRGRLRGPRLSRARSGRSRRSGRRRCSRRARGGTGAAGAAAIPLRSTVPTGLPTQLPQGRLRSRIQSTSTPAAAAATSSPASR